MDHQGTDYLEKGRRSVPELLRNSFPDYKQQHWRRRSAKHQPERCIADDYERSEFRYLSRTIQTVDFQVLCSYLHEVDFPLRVYHVRAFLRKRTRDFRLRTAFRYHNH